MSGLVNTNTVRPMIKFASVLLLGALATTASIVTGTWTSAARAAEVCAAVPDVEWWNTSHQKMTKFVEIKHKGNWRPYLESWEKQLDRLQVLYDGGRSAYIRSRKLTLQSDDLLDYIDKVAQRVEIIKCLRSNELEARVAADKNDKPVSGFGKGRAFGAKSPPATRRQSAAKSKQVVKVADREIQLSVATRCVGPMAVFEISNDGEKWPRLATIGVYQVDGKKAVTKRRMRLAKGQVVTFRQAKQDKNYDGAIGLYIDPTWFERAAGIDAEILCKSAVQG